MNRLILPVGAVSLTALLITSAVATEPLKSGEWSYTVIDGTATIVGYSGPGGDVVFPSEIEGMPVTMIDKPDFGEVRESVTSIEMPDSVTFLNCGSFIDLPALTKVSLGKSVTGLGVGLFGGCNELTNISVSPDNPHLVCEDGVVFTKDKSELIRCLPSKTGEYTVPESVRNIRQQAFSGNQLTKVVISEGVKEIDWGAFYGSRNLKSLSVPESVEKIHDYAFPHCEGLEEFSVPLRFINRLEPLGLSSEVIARLGLPGVLATDGNLLKFRKTDRVNRVEIRGSFDNWQNGRELKPSGEDTTVAELDIKSLGLAEGKYEYKFLVNGQFEEGDNRTLSIGPDGAVVN
jgi:hypothetical protein